MIWSFLFDINEEFGNVLLLLLFVNFTVGVIELSIIVFDSVSTVVINGLSFLSELTLYCPVLLSITKDSSLSLIVWLVMNWLSLFYIYIYIMFIYI